MIDDTSAALMEADLFESERRVRVYTEAPGFCHGPRLTCLCHKKWSGPRSQEIRAMLQQGMGWDDYANDLCDELDANGDGLVSFAEFVIGFQRFCDKAFAVRPKK